MSDASPADSTRVTVEDRMTRKVITIAPSDSCQRALRIMHQAQINHLPVLDGERLVGIITDRDIYRRSPQEATTGRGRPQKKLLALVAVGAVMTYRPVTVTPATSVREAVEVMLKRRVGCLPVLRGGSLIGVLTTRDAIGFLAGVAKESLGGAAIGVVSAEGTQSTSNWSMTTEEG